jgi:chorismate mutase
MELENVLLFLRYTVPMSAPHRTYHTDVKFAAFWGLLPEDIAQLIPKSTLSDMRRRDPSYIWGSDFAAIVERMDLMKEIAKSRATLKAATTVLCIVHLVRSIGVPFHHIPKVKDPEVREKILATLERLKGHLPLEALLKLLGLTRSQFHAWSRNLFACTGSPHSLCRKVYPNQLTRSEIAVIREAFSDPAHLHWPAASVAWNSSIAASFQPTFRLSLATLGSWV